MRVLITWWDQGSESFADPMHHHLHHFGTISDWRLVSLMKGAWYFVPFGKQQQAAQWLEFIQHGTQGIWKTVTHPFPRSILIADFSPTYQSIPDNPLDLLTTDRRTVFQWSDPVSQSYGNIVFIRRAGLQVRQDADRIHRPKSRFKDTFCQSFGTLASSSALLQYPKEYPRGVHKLADLLWIASPPVFWHRKLFRFSRDPSGNFSAFLEILAIE
jgi:hypothetical protein